MSHNVRLNNVKFSNIDILRAAVNEMRNEGANIELIETGGMARISGAGGRDVQCDVLIKVNDGRWDIGFHRNDKGELIPEVESDFRHPMLSGDYYDKPVEGCQTSYSGLQVGGLSQRYALISAEVNAAQAGYSTQRSYDSTKRQYNLEVTVG